MTKEKKIKFFFVIVCLLQIFYIFYFRSGFQTEILKNPFDKNAGIKFALPAEAIESKTIINNKKLNKFNLSKKIKDNIYLYQRILEFNYPIRIDKKSNNLFILNGEKIPNKCKEIEKGNFLVLVKCKYD
tara:strand:+ start:423 stop:809 length:387 start_codon:yes stop_codon:yes gene_type:complete